MEMVGQMSLSCISAERVGVIAMQPYQVPIVPQYFSSHRWKSTKYPHDLWTRSKSHQILYDSGIDPWWPTWFHPCHAMSGDSLCHFESQQTFRNAAEGGSRWGVGVPAADRGPKKAHPRQRSVLLLRYCPRLSHWGFCLLLGWPVLLVLVLLFRKQGSLGLELLWKHGGI